MVMKIWIITESVLSQSWVLEGFFSGRAIQMSFGSGKEHVSSGWATVVNFISPTRN